jgi:PiT family inorganic phosphate transporter
MLTIIGIFPATYALNPAAHQSLSDMSSLMQQAVPLMQQYGDDQKETALAAAESIARQSSAAPISDSTQSAAGEHPRQSGRNSGTAQIRTSIRDNVYQVISQLKHAEESKRSGAEEKKTAQKLAKALGKSVEYAPFWVRMLSALCLGIGTMIGYKRIVTTLGERLGNIHLTPAQGASAEVVAAVLIGTAGFTGLPVSTTHIVTSGIAGTMVTSGAGLKYGMVSRIAIAWLITLPVTISIAGGLYYLLANPKL